MIRMALNSRNEPLEMNWRFAVAGVLLSLTMLGCDSRSSVLTITHEDRAMFDFILSRPSDEVRFFTASDGTSIACTVIWPQADPVAVVAFIHGIAVASRLYTPMADMLAADGYLVTMMDIRGHGFSEGEPGDVPTGASLLKDARDFLGFVREEEGDELPLIAVGHSLGTYIWMATLQSFSEVQVDGIILMSGGVVPQKRSKTPSGRTVGTFIRGHRVEFLLSFLFPGLKPIEIVLPQESQGEDQRLVTRYSRRFFQSLDIGKQSFGAFYGSFNGPILMISGEKDEIMPAAQVRAAYDKLQSSDKSIEMMDELTHTSIIWHGAPVIAGWLDERFKP